MTHDNMPVSRNYWIDNLRSFITILVVAHHAALAYTSFSYFDPVTYINSTHPIVDARRTIVLDVLVTFNDIFFMPLMFLISGLFLYGGLTKKGEIKLVWDRVKRLGLPFLFAELFIIPLAYIPSYTLVNGHFTAGRFISDYLYHQQWPVGPPWFIWLLLAFTVLVAMIPRVYLERLGAITSRAAKRPFLFLLCCFLVTGAALVPISLELGAFRWTGWGPFDFQLNRVAFYFAYFLLGVALGTFEWQSILFTAKNLLNLTTGWWAGLALVSFGIVELFNYRGYFPALNPPLQPGVANLISLLLFTVASILICFAFLSFFRNFRNSTTGKWTSLAANAYGIYLLHYVFVTWVQYGLLNVNMPALLKFSIVFILALAASWWSSSVIRRRFGSGII